MREGPGKRERGLVGMPDAHASLPREKEFESALTELQVHQTEMRNQRLPRYGPLIFSKVTSIAPVIQTHCDFWQSRFMKLRVKVELELGSASTKDRVGRSGRTG